MIVSLLLYLLVIRSMALSPRQDRPSTTLVMMMCMTFDGHSFEGHDQDEGYDDDGHVHGDGFWPRCERHIVTVVATAIVRPTDHFAPPALLG
jgi:hypothetical protein